MHHIILSNNINNIELSNNLYHIDKNDYEEDYNHLVKSLRIREGEKIKVDTLDKSFIGTVMSIADNDIEIKKIEDIEVRDTNIRINLYQGTPKSDKLELIIEKAVELGVSSITPVNMQNSIKVLDLLDNKKLDRYRKIAHSAALQSMRHSDIEVRKVMSYQEMLSIINKDKYNILLYENEKDFTKLKNIIDDIKKDKDTSKDIINVNIIVGPEGGFSAKEIAEAREYNIETFSLGDLILRTETAPLMILSILRFLL